MWEPGFGERVSRLPQLKKYPRVRLDKKGRPRERTFLGLRDSLVSMMSFNVQQIESNLLWTKLKTSVLTRQHANKDKKLLKDTKDQVPLPCDLYPLTHQDLQPAWEFDTINNSILLSKIPFYSLIISISSVGKLRQEVKNNRVNPSVQIHLCQRSQIFSSHSPSNSE